MKRNLKLKFNKLNKRLLYLKEKINNSKDINSNNFNYILYKEYFNCLKINNIFNKYIKFDNELNSLKELNNDKELYLLVKEEKFKLKNILKKLENKLNCFFLFNKKNKNDNLNIYLEIHAGTGGNEASIFVSDLFKMYVKYCEKMKWKVELINFNNSNCKGYKYIICKIIGKCVYKNLKFESGGHRVQRVPKTESKGRIHTSTCIVAVTPVLPNIKLPIINNEDIKIDTFKSSGAGGQHVNTTDSAVRITHIPTGIIVECQQERSQHKNKSKALEVLKSRIYNLEISKRNKDNNKKRKNLLGTGFRNDRNRTYNFVQNRITDHRINLNIYSLDKILNGDLDLLLKPLLNKFNSN